MNSWRRKNLDIEIVSGDLFDASLDGQAGGICAGDRIGYDELIKKGNSFMVQGC